METLVIQVETSDKIKKLVDFLKTLEYVVSIERQDNFQKIKLIYQRLHEGIAQTELADLTEEEIFEIVKEAKHADSH